MQEWIPGVLTKNYPHTYLLERDVRRRMNVVGSPHAVLAMLPEGYQRVTRKITRLDDAAVAPLGQALSVWFRRVGRREVVENDMGGGIGVVQGKTKGQATFNPQHLGVGKNGENGRISGFIIGGVISVLAYG